MRKISVCLILVIVSLCFTNNACLTRAEDYDVDKEVASPFYPNHDFNVMFLNIYNIKKTTSIKNINIENTNICKLYNNDAYGGKTIDYGSDSCCIFLKSYSRGTTYVNGDIYEGDKFIKSFKTKIIVYKYKNPFKKFKIGNKSMIKKFNKKAGIYTKIKKTKKYKISYKLKKKYEMEDIIIDDMKKEKDIKNNKKIKIKKKKYYYISIEVWNNKYKTYESYEININYN